MTIQDVVMHIQSRPWELWLSLAVLSALAEILFSTFSFIFVSTAALLVALISSYMGWTAQLVVFSITLILSAAAIRPTLIARFSSSKKMPSRAESMIGKSGQVTDAIDPGIGTGRVLIDGQDWAAQALQNIPVGERIIVEAVDGISLKVRRI